MKIILNKCYGGFGISDEALRMAGITDTDEWGYDDLRTNPEVIKAVEILGEDANDEYSDLVVVEISDAATDWEVDATDWCPWRSSWHRCTDKPFPTRARRKPAPVLRERHCWTTLRSRVAARTAHPL